MRTPLFRVGFAMVSSIMLTVVACGGAKEGQGAKAPEAGPRASEESAPSAGDAAGTANETTTTTELGPGGDLQGAKLGSSARATTETKSDGGPKSTGGKSAGEPGRTAEDIRVIVMARRDEARACYDKALATHPGIEGDLDVKWVIDPEGNVTDASVDTTRSSILEPSVGQCIVDVIRSIKFAASAKGYETRAHYPFNFHPKQAVKDAGK